MMLIQVRRKGNTLSYISKPAVSQVEDGECIISICDEEERRPVWKPNQKVLELTSGLHGLDGEAFHKASFFLQEHKGKNIYVHCYMGQIRSKHLCENLAIRNKPYIVVRGATDSIIYETIKV